MYLRPSEIRFSQDSIGSTFGSYTSHPFKQIGETLDEILTGKINVNSIPSISVCKKDGKWFTADNRRLWVLQEAEKLGKCREICVRETSYINYNKFTTVNNGLSVYIRGNPGGYVWESMPNKRIQLKKTPQITSLPSAKPYNYLTPSSPIYQKQNQETNPSEIWSTKIESKSETFNEGPMSKGKEGLCFEQDIHKYEEEVIKDSGNQINMDIDSESDNKDVQQPASSSNFEISQLQDIANGLDQVYDSTEERKVEIKIEEKREEKIEDEKETQDIEEVVINVSNVPNTHTNAAFLSLNSEEELAQVDNKSVAVTISEETQTKTIKSTYSKRCICIICVIISIAILCLLLAIVLGIILT